MPSLQTAAEVRIDAINAMHTAQHFTQETPCTKSLYTSNTVRIRDC